MFQVFASETDVVFAPSNGSLCASPLLPPGLHEPRIYISWWRRRATVSITIHEVSGLAGQAVCVTPALGAGRAAELAQPPLRVLVGALGAVSTALLPEAAQETQEHPPGG